MGKVSIFLKFSIKTVLSRLLRVFFLAFVCESCEACDRILKLVKALAKFSKVVLSMSLSAVSIVILIAVYRASLDFVNRKA